MVFVYSALFNNVADKTLRSQIEEQLSQEVRLQRNVTEDQLRTFLAQRREAKLRQYHLNEPLPSRIFWRAVRTLQFDYGNATTMKAANGDRLVMNIILEALPRTVILFTTEVILTTLLGVAWASTWPRAQCALDRFSSAVTMISNGLPSWWLGLIFIMAFSYGVPIFPSGGLHINPAPRGWPVSSISSGTFPCRCSRLFFSPSGAPRTSRATSCSPISRRTTSWPPERAESPNGACSSGTRFARRCPPS